MPQIAELLTVKEAAKRLGLSEACLRAWIGAERITYVRLGRAIRIPEGVLTELVQQSTVQAKKRRRKCG